MTLGGKLVSLFPLFYLLTILSWIGTMFSRSHYLNVPVLLFLVYLFPLIAYRIHSLFFPLGDGFWDITEKKYNPWWGSHMFQFPFIACPWLEALIHFCPGLYSLWLRGWGSKIGKNIFWTPRVEILDRGLVEIGDNCVFGHMTILCSHMVAKIDGRPCLVLKKIQIGERCFIGADSQFGPGVIVPDQTKVPVKSRLFWRGEWK